MTIFLSLKVCISSHSTRPLTRPNFIRPLRIPYFIIGLSPYQLTSYAATVQKIVSEILPPSTGVSFSKEARDLLIECCVEFITLVSSEANEISEKEAKKTIACDHITKALDTLGFGDYVPAVLEAAAQHKETQRVRSFCTLPLFTSKDC